MDDIDEAEAEMHAFLDELDCDPEFREMARALWVQQFNMERERRRLN